MRESKQHQPNTQQQQDPPPQQQQQGESKHHQQNSQQQQDPPQQQQQGEMIKQIENVLIRFDNKKHHYNHKIYSITVYCTTVKIHHRLTKKIGCAESSVAEQ